MCPQEPWKDEADTASFPKDANTIPVLEEQLVVNKERVLTGLVKVSKHVSQEQVALDLTSTQEHVTVERKPVNQYVDTAPEPVVQKGNVTIISVVKEVLVVEKKLMLVEEVHITKHQHTSSETHSQNLRKEEITVSREAPGTDV
jgi:uncharacterized protein (TIGR02271 family)